MRIRRFSLLLACGVLFSCDGKEKAAGDLIDAFKSSCSSWGPWSDGARAQTQSLITTFENLKASKANACASFQATIENVSQLAAKAHGVYGDSAYLAYQQKQEELQELMLTLSTAQDPDTIASLKVALVDTQVELAKARAQANKDKKDKNDKVGYDDRYSQATRELSDNFTALYAQADSLGNCLRADPSAALKLGTALLGVGGSFMSPLVGAGTYIAGNLMAITVKAIDGFKIDDAIWKLDGGLLPGALTCGLDSMESYYCQAEDAFRLLRYHATRYPNEDKPVDEFWRGLDLLSRRLPVLNSWLLDIKGGVQPENPEDAQRINRVLEKYSKLDIRNNDVVGTLNQGITLSSRANDDETRRSYLAQYVINVSQLIRGETGGFGSPTTNDPFTEFSSSSKSYACWLFRGYVGVNSCPTSSEIQSLENYVRLELMPKAPNASLENILTVNWPSVLEQVRRQVDIEFNEAIFIDPITLIPKASESDAAGDSPLNSLRMIKEFLVTFRQQSVRLGHTSRLLTIDDTIATVDQAVSIIDSYGHHNFVEGCIMASAGPQQPCNPLGEIFNLFQLKNGTQAFSKRLTSLIEWDLQDRFKEGELPKNIEDVLLYAGGEIRHRLLASGTQDFDSLAQDLDQARGIAENNLNVFRTSFGDPLARSIRELEKITREREGGVEGPDRIYGQRLARLCMTVISSGETWPGQVSWDLCKNQNLYSILPDPQHKLQIQMEALERAIRETKDPTDRRVARRCAFYNFRRASRISQIMRGKARKLLMPELEKFSTEQIYSDLMQSQSKH